MVLPLDPLSRSTARLLNRLIANPCTVTGLNAHSPMPEPVSRLPSSSISGVPVYVGCEVVSMTTGCVMNGRSLVGRIVCTPAPGMANVIVSVLTVALAAVIASRSVQSPPARGAQPSTA